MGSGITKTSAGNADAAGPPSQLPVTFTMRSAERPPEPIADDRNTVAPGESVVLIVEDDPHFARLMMGAAREKGFKVLIATRGTEALALAREHHPTAISLGIFLPD